MDDDSAADRCVPLVTLSQEFGGQFLDAALQASTDDPEDSDSFHEGFGAKTIGSFAGFCLLCNSIIGPGMPGLPNVFVEAGWLLPSIVVFAIWFMTYLSCSMFSEVMRNIPGNEHFRSRVEYTSIVKHYLGRRVYLGAVLMLNGALMSLNVVSIIQSSQVMDGTISALFKKSCGLNLTPFKNYWTDRQGQEHLVAKSDEIFSCIDVHHLDGGHAWGCHIIVTIGFVLVLMMAVPCSMWNLEDNMIIQIVCLIFGITCILSWTAISLASYSSMEHAGLGVPTFTAVNTQPSLGSQAGVLGAMLFNWNLLTTVPSWVNEKKPGVSTNKTILRSTTFCLIMYYVVCFTGACAFSDILQGPVSGTCARQIRDPSFDCPNDLMQVFTRRSLIDADWRRGKALDIFIQTSVYLFPIVEEVSGIPVFSIIIKYNLIENGFSRGFATFFGVALPWMIALPALYMPNVLAQFINFTSLVFATMANFVVPLVVYAYMQRRAARAGSPMEDASPSGVYVHHALPLKFSPQCKAAVAVTISVLLTVGASVAIVLTVQQGKYTMNQQSCALVGS